MPQRKPVPAGELSDVVLSNGRRPPKSVLGFWSRLLDRLEIERPEPGALRVELVSTRSKLRRRLSFGWRFFMRLTRQELSDAPGVESFMNLDEAFEASEEFANFGDKVGDLVDDEVAWFVAEAPDDPWILSGAVAREDGHYIITRLTISPHPLRPIVDGDQKAPAGGITSAVLRSVRLGRLISEITRESTNQAKWHNFFEPAEPVDAPARATGRSLGDDFLSELAGRYLEEQARGRGVYRRLSVAEFEHAPKRSGGPIPEQTVRSWIKQAELRGFLTSGTRGRLDRRPGPRLSTDQEIDR